MPSPESIALLAIIFFGAGWVKGVVGMGLPTVAMGALGLMMAPVQAAALLIIPSLVTNIWQFAAGQSKWLITRRLASMMIFICIGTAVGIPFLTSGSSRGPSAALGAVLAAYALLGLFLPKIGVPHSSERALSPVIGGITGVLAGATGVFVVPAVPYLSAIGLGKDELIQALGLSFTVSTVALAIALGSTGSYPPTVLFASFAAVVPAIIGMFVGQKTRDRVEPAAFRKWFLIAMLVVGTYMLGRGVVQNVA